jgi:hypothetical protein
MKPDLSRSAQAFRDIRSGGTIMRFMPVMAAALCSLTMCGIAVAQQAARPAGEVVGFGPHVADSQLAQASGGTNVLNRMTLNGTVSGNSADRVVTGDNVISGSSLQGSAGLPMVIQNSGNNVLIQNATIVNVQFQP